MIAERRLAVPADGKPRQLQDGTFVAYVVDAVDRDMARMQGRIQARIDALNVTDVVAVTPALDASGAQLDRSWRVELQIDTGASLGLLP